VTFADFPKCKLMYGVYNPQKHTKERKMNCDDLYGVVIIELVNLYKNKKTMFSTTLTMLASRGELVKVSES